jgi:hypothetical protein
VFSSLSASFPFHNRGLAHFFVQKGLNEMDNLDNAGFEFLEKTGVAAPKGKLVGGMQFTSKKKLETFARSYLLACVDKNKTRFMPKAEIETDDFLREFFAASTRMPDKIKYVGGLGKYQGIEITHNAKPNRIAFPDIVVVGTAGQIRASISWNAGGICADVFEQTSDNLVPKLIASMRRMVQPQIDEFRKSQPRVNGQIMCVASHDWFNPIDIEIDHHPVSFDDLATRYILDIKQYFNIEFGRDFCENDLNISSYLTPDKHFTFKDEDLNDTWKVYHAANAELRAISYVQHKLKTFGGAV